MRRVIQLGLIVSISFLLGISDTPLYATSVNSAISQGFKSEDDLSIGQLVSFDAEAAESMVKLADTTATERLAGVVADKPLIQLSDGTSQTQVVSSGVTLVLVSDINGEINNGDKITASPLKGLGMKAIESGIVLGSAQADFSNASQVSQRTIVSKEGTREVISVGLLPVQIDISYYKDPGDDLVFLPPFLQNFVEAVAGREVSPVRVLASFVTLLAGIVAVAVLLYASIRSSIISIGRNPLAAKAVHRSLMEVGVTAVGVLLVTLIAVYLVLVI